MSKTDLKATLPASVDPRRKERDSDNWDSSIPPASTPSSDPVAEAGWGPTPARSIPAPPPAPMHVTVPVPGMVLGGKYRIERVLGTGGIAVVAAAWHLQLQRLVAIKYLLVEALEYPEIVERFTREARAAARIRGEHVARVIDVGVFDGGAPYIVLEYLEGMDLDEYLKQRGPLPIPRAIRYILQTCEALAEAHAAKIVHRDLKPSNLFLAKTPARRKVIKVLDFGVSKILDEPMTNAGRMLGTVMYMSPEQVRAAQEVDLRTDIWSLGVILYELLTGAPPFLGQTIVSVAESIEKNSPRPISEIRSDVPPALAAVIDKCLRSDPEERYATVLELALALAPFAKSQDRDSVRMITGVLRGSLPPTAFDSGDLSGQIPAIPANPAPNVTPSATPRIPTPPPIGSDAPISVDATKPPPAIAGLPKPKVQIPRSWVRAHAPWLVAGAMMAGILVFGGLALSPQLSPPKAAAPAAPTEVSVRITSRTPNTRVRIDDGPLLALPLEMGVPRDEREHNVYFEADGHTAQTLKVHFRDDLHIAMSLSPR